MDFAFPAAISQDMVRFREFLEIHVKPRLPEWHRNRTLPREFFQELGRQGWCGFRIQGTRLEPSSSLKRAALIKELAHISPGTAIALLVQEDLGTLGLSLFGPEKLREEWGASALRGETLICLGNTEGHAGSDVAGIATQATRVEGGWKISGVKSYVTNGAIADLGIITAVTDPGAARNNRISMFLVDLAAEGIRRRKLHKQVWLPSDLTRIQLSDVFVSEDRLLGDLGRGLQQVLSIFTHSRITISALTLGTAEGALTLARDHARKRHIFGKKIIDFQAKAFEMADLFAKLEAARLMLWKACWTADAGRDFRLDSSLAKYLCVQAAREITSWSADIFGAASVMLEHPVHKFPMDTWGASLGEGTQDVQKLIIFREMMKKTGFTGSL